MTNKCQKKCFYCMIPGDKIFDLDPILSREEPMGLIYFTDYMECVNPDGPVITIPSNKIDEINEFVTKFRKEHGISDIL